MAKMIDGFCTTRCQSFNTEMIKNERKLRMRWFTKNRELLLDNLRDDKVVRRLEEKRNKLEDDHLRRLQEDAKKIPEDDSLQAWRPLKSDGSVTLDVMKPIDSVTRSILYKPGVESFLAGQNYLRERYKDKPEDRFYYPDCTNWIYGWRLADYSRFR